MGSKRPGFLVRFDAPGFSRSEGHDTEEAAFAAARQARALAEQNRPINVNTWIDGAVACHEPGAIWVLKWHEEAQDWLTHARTWRKNQPRPAALTPLPADYWDGHVTGRR